MKGKKLIFTVASAFLISGALVGCKKSGPTEQPACTAVTLNQNSISFVGEGDTFDLDAILTLVGGAKEEDYTQTWSSSDPTVATVDQDGLVTAVASEGSAVITVTVDGKTATCTVSFYPKASGFYDFSKKSNAERTEIIGVLEKWAVDNKLTGITIYEDGGYQMYNPRVKRPAPTYIKDFGFGTLSEGTLEGPLAGEPDAKYKMYYHSYTSSDPANMLYMDDQGSVVSSLVGYSSGAYFDSIMDETRTGFIWHVADLARSDQPIPVNPGEDGASSEYLIPVKTGSQLKYSTLSKDPTLSQFNNREVQLEDYLTPYKVYYTKAFGVARNAEVKDSNPGSLVGGEAYVKASAGGFNEQAFDNVGVHVVNDPTYGACLKFNLTSRETPFWAAYYLNSSMFAPVPEDFLLALGGNDLANGVKLWGKFNNSATLSPVDTFLTTGPYVLEDWVKDNLIVWKRNPNYVYGEDKNTSRPSHYYIEGVHMDILPALTTGDTEAALKMFLADGYQLDVVTIPSTRLSDFLNDPRTVMIPGATTTKLNLNTCTQDQWIDLFGVYGSITQTAPANYWECEPAMANKHFVDGLSFAIDRKTFAATLGYTPSADYFGSSYYSDPENGIHYNDTEAHAKAMEEFLEGTEFGFSLEKAKAAFKLASDELIADGQYKLGDTISIEMAWQSASDEDHFAKPLAKFITDAFNDCGGGLKLEVTHFYPQVWSDVYYKKMMVGQFDIGFGGVEGNSLNPLNFFEVLKSDNSSTFTLNWGIPTNEYAELLYDGQLWTFDGLWTAADHGGYIVDGANSPTYEAWLESNPVRNADGSLTFEIHSLGVDLEEVKTDLAYVCLYATTDSNYSDYTEMYFLFNGSVFLDGVQNITDEVYFCLWQLSNELGEYGEEIYTLTISAGCIDLWLTWFPNASLYDQGLDVYFAQQLAGETEASVGFYATIWGNYIPGIPQN